MNGQPGSATVDRPHADAIDGAITRIAGDVDLSTGHIEASGDVRVSGTVRDTMKIVSGGSVQVDRHVEAAEIRAKLDIRVAGTVAGKVKGQCIAGRDLHARHINSARVEAGGDVVSTEITHGHIACGGRLRLTGGTLLAAHVTALGGVECSVLGSSAGVRTIVEAGIDAALRQQIAAEIKIIQAKRQRINKIRQSIEPLMRHQKALSPAQKEQATELLFQASDMEDEIRAVVTTLLARHKETSALASRDVHVEQAVHPGVIIRFPEVEAIVTASIDGPMRIIPCTERNEQRVVLELLDGSDRKEWLESRSQPDEALAMLQREMTQMSGGERVA